MGTEFLRLRRKNALWRILRALLTGIAAGLLLAGGLMAMFIFILINGDLLHPLYNIKDLQIESYIIPLYN